MRGALAKLTLADVNAAVRKHFSGDKLQALIITKDVKGLAATLLSDAPSKVTYDAPKSQAVLDEDREIGALKLGLRPEAVTITKVAEVFAK